MKKFLAVFIGTEAALERSQWKHLDDKQRKERETAGIKAWKEWGVAHATSVLDHGTPLGKTKRIDPEGVADIKNVLCAYVIVQAQDHAAAAKLFENHPHFTIFPGDSVEIMECLPVPGQ